MAKTHVSIPLMIVPYSLSLRISRPLAGIGETITRFYPGLEYDLEEAEIKETPSKYVAASLVTCIAMFLLLFALQLFLVVQVQGKTIQYGVLTGIAYGLGMFALFLFLLLRYPSILARKRAEQVDKSLIFALKDLLLNISSGVSLYNAMINVAKANYGVVSEEFDKAVRSINSGTPMDKALENMATSSKSEFMRRTMWQLVNTMKAGASLQGALRNIIDELTITQRSKIRDYARELNLWSLLYMLFAVAVPTIGATMMVILSSFAGFNITKATFILMIILTFLVQVVIIGLIKSRRPIVQF